MGYSRRVLSRKIHGVADISGNPVRLLINTGQASECSQVNKLPENLNYQYLLTDKEYDSDEITSTDRIYLRVSALLPYSYEKLHSCTQASFNQIVTST
ncbi:MAG: hypothetical protein OXC48_11390 [Endozoicomonadaceae bacterium]|nr:hypothetical protein [Endozoicomonadaceae bacterium]